MTIIKSKLFTSEINLGYTAIMAANRHWIYFILVVENNKFSLGGKRYHPKGSCFVWDKVSFRQIK